MRVQSKRGIDEIVYITYTYTSLNRYRCIYITLPLLTPDLISCLRHDPGTTCILAHRNPLESVKGEAALIQTVVMTRSLHTDQLWEAGCGNQVYVYRDASV